MFYFGIGILLIVTGLCLGAVGSSYLPPGSRLPIDFGEYKDAAVIFFLYVGAFLVWLGIKNIRQR